MAGRGPQSFKKRQREQLRKERHHAKIEKRLQRKREGPGEENPSDESLGDENAEGLEHEAAALPEGGSEISADAPASNLPS